MESKVMTGIIKILSSDVSVVGKWTEMFDGLGLSKDIHNLKTSRKCGTLSNYDLFTTIIETWRSEQGEKATVQELCQVLETLKCINASEKIAAAFNTGSVDSPDPIFFGFDRMSKNFTGRSEQIDKIDKLLRESEDFVKIIGMGGIGKTELAKKFATVHREWNCIWLNAENAGVLKTSIVTFGESLGIKLRDDSMVNLFRSCLEYIRKQNGLKVLVIIDNVDVNYDEAVDIIDVIKDFNHFAIVTSRNVGVVDFAGEAVNLEILEDKEAFQLVCSSLEDESEEDINSLCELLDNFPLALQQAVSFIKKKKAIGVCGKSYKIPNYVEHFKKQQQQLLDFPLNRLDHNYSKTTFITWKTSIEAIEGEPGEGAIVAIDILNIIAFLEADGIRLAFIEVLYKNFDGSKPGATNEVIEDAVEILIAYSLARVDRERLSVHRLVQEVIRVTLVDKQVRVKLIRAIHAIGYDLHDDDMQSVLSVWKYFSQLDDDELNKEFMKHRVKIINRFFSWNNDGEYFPESLEMSIRLLGQDHPLTLVIESRGAYSLIYQEDEGSLEKLKTLYVKQTEIEEEQESLITGYCLVIAILVFGQISEALELLRTLRLRDHVAKRFLLSIIDDVARQFSKLRRFGEATEMHEHALQCLIANKGHEHSWAIRRRDKISRISRFLRGHIIKGEWERVLQVQIRVLGPDHHVVLHTKQLIEEHEICEDNADSDIDDDNLDSDEQEFLSK